MIPEARSISIFVDPFNTRASTRANISPMKEAIKWLEGGGVLAIGKTEDLFANRGITRSQHTLTDAAGMRALSRAAAEAEEKLIFANVVDLDMLYGHRNNIQ